MAPGARPWVTLFSDIGWAYAAQMKGEILRRRPGTPLVDLTHEVSSHSVLEGSFLFRQILSGFPPGGIHVAVVDPGVGGPRAPVAMGLTDGSRLVGPDNGLLVPAAEARGLREVVRLDPRRVGAPRGRSATFDGRDLFAPAAAELARGRRLRQLGTPWVAQPSVLPEAVLGRRVARGCVVHVDRFGNLVTNVPAGWSPGPGGRLTLVLAGRRRSLPTARAYVDLNSGALGVLASSFGTLEVSAREASAASRLSATVGASLRLERPLPANR